MRSSRRDRGIAATRVWVADLVRSGLLEPQELRAQVVQALGQDHPRLPAAETAAEWIACAVDDWQRDADGWAEETGHDRLMRAFADLEGRGFVVLQGCAEHWAARDELDRRTTSPRGVLWFLAVDVWHAISEPMLEVNLWHPDGANAAPGDPLLGEVLAVLHGHGLAAHFDEGRIEVQVLWQRRPPQSDGESYL